MLAVVPLAYELWVDDTRIYAQTVTAGSATVNWDTRTVAKGSHGVGFRVRHPASEALLAEITLPVTVSNTEPPPPPPGELKVFITHPKAGSTVSGTVWVVMWVEGTSGSSNVFTLSVDGKVINSATTSSRGPVTIPWFTVNNPNAGNGTHTLGASVRDATGKIESTSITVIVNQPVPVGAARSAHDVRAARPGVHRGNLREARRGMT